MIPGRTVSTFTDTAACGKCGLSWEVTTRIETGLLDLNTDPDEYARKERLGHIMRAQEEHRLSVCPYREVRE